MILGLTGHSGSGKTTAAEIFERQGFYRVDCDRIVHTRVYTDRAVHAVLADAFGDDIIKDGAVDRRRLAAVIFSDDSQYNKLMTLVKPFIDAAVLREIAAGGDRPVLVDAPALFEYGMERLCDVTLGVVSNAALERIVARDGITENEAQKRLSHQQTHEFYKTNCDYVIENNGELWQFEQAVLDICKKITKGGIA